MEARVLVSKDEDGFYIAEDTLEDSISEALWDEGNVRPYIVDSGIGSYEYWGIPGYDSHLEVDEVEGDDVEFHLMFVFDETVPENERERAAADVLPLCTPTITEHHSTEAHRKSFEYTVEWDGELNEETKVVKYSARLA